MASLCSSRLSTTERFKIRQDSDCWSSRLISTVGLDKILELLFRTRVLEDLRGINDRKPPATTTKWSFEESCLFCLLRRDKVKEHVIALTRQIVESGGKPLLGKDPSNISRLEWQSEEFLSAVLHRKDYRPRIPDPHIPVVACGIMQLMMSELSFQYTASRCSPEPIQSPARVPSSFPTEDQDTPLDLSVKKIKSEEIQQDGVLDLSTKKNVSSGLPLVKSSPIHVSSLGLLMREPPVLDRLSTPDQFMSNLCQHHQRQTIDALAFFHSEIKTPPSSKHFQPIKAHTSQKHPPPLPFASSRADRLLEDVKPLETRVVRSPKTLIEALNGAASAAPTVTEQTDFSKTESSSSSPHRNAFELGSVNSSVSLTNTSADLETSASTNVQCSESVQKCERSAEPSFLKPVHTQTSSSTADKAPAATLITQNACNLDSRSSLRTARKTMRGSSQRSCILNDPDRHCDLVYINKSIIECQANSRNRLQPRKNARKSTRGHSYIEEYLELKTVRTLSRGSRENCSSQLLHMHALVIPKQTVSSSGSIPVVNTPSTGDCMKSVIQKLSLEETPGDVVKEVSLTAETSQTDKTDACVQISYKALPGTNQEEHSLQNFQEQSDSLHFETNDQLINDPAPLSEETENQVSQESDPQLESIHTAEGENYPNILQEATESVADTEGQDSQHEPLASMESESKIEEKSLEVSEYANMETESSAERNNVETVFEVEAEVHLDTEPAVIKHAEQSDLNANLANKSMDDAVAILQTVDFDEPPEHANLGTSIMESSVVKSKKGHGTPKGLKARNMDISDRQLRSRGSKGNAEVSNHDVNPKTQAPETNTCSRDEQNSKCLDDDGTVHKNQGLESAVKTTPKTRKGSVWRKNQQPVTPTRGALPFTDLSGTENIALANAEVTEELKFFEQPPNHLETVNEIDEDILKRSNRSTVGAKSYPVGSILKMGVGSQKDRHPSTPKRTELLNVLSSIEHLETEYTDSATIQLDEQIPDCLEPKRKGSLGEIDDLIQSETSISNRNTSIKEKSTQIITDRTPTGAKSSTTGSKSRRGSVSCENKQANAMEKSLFLPEELPETEKIVSEHLENREQLNPIEQDAGSLGGTNILINFKDSTVMNNEMETENITPTSKGILVVSKSTKTGAKVSSNKNKRSSIRNKSTPLFKKSDPSENNSSDSTQGKVEGILLGVKSTLFEEDSRPVESESTPFGAKSTMVKEDSRQVVGGTTVGAKHTVVEEDSRPVEAEGIPVDAEINLDKEDSKPLESESTTVGAMSTLVEEDIRAVEAKGVPVDAKSALVNEDSRLVEVEGTLIGAKSTLVEEDSRPVEAERTQVGFKRTPDDAKTTSVKAETTPRCCKNTLVEAESNLVGGESSQIKHKSSSSENESSQIITRHSIGKSKSITGKSTPGCSKSTPVEADRMIDSRQMEAESTLLVANRIRVSRKSTLDYAKTTQVGPETFLVIAENTSVSSKSTSVETGSNPVGGRRSQNENKSSSSGNCSQIKTRHSFEKMKLIGSESAPVCSKSTNLEPESIPIVKKSKLIKTKCSFGKNKSQVKTKCTLVEGENNFLCGKSTKIGARSSHIEEDNFLKGNKSSQLVTNSTLGGTKSTATEMKSSPIEYERTMIRTEDAPVKAKSNPIEHQRSPIGPKRFSVGNKRSCTALLVSGDSSPPKKSQLSSEIMALRSRINTEQPCNSIEEISALQELPAAKETGSADEDISEEATRMPLRSWGTIGNKDSWKTEQVTGSPCTRAEKPLRSSGTVQASAGSATVESPGRMSLRGNVSNTETLNSPGSLFSNAKQPLKILQDSPSSSGVADDAVRAKAKKPSKKQTEVFWKSPDVPAPVLSVQKPELVTSNKFLEVLQAEEHQQLISSLNARFEKMNKGWVQTDREVQPAPKPKNKGDRLKEIWKSRRRVRKLRPLEQPRFSPVQMLFMKPFQLSSICSWFLQSTETKSLVIVKKLNTRLPSETQLCFPTASANGIFPSLQAERLKKHLKKFAIASPVKNNAKNQRLLAKALAQNFNVSPEKREPTAAARICTKAQSLSAVMPTPTSETVNLIPKNPASARILRKYSNMREKLQVQNSKCKKTKPKEKGPVHKTKSVAVDNIKAEQDSKAEHKGATKSFKKLKTMTKIVGKQTMVKTLRNKLKIIKASSSVDDATSEEQSLLPESKTVIEDQVLTRSQRKMETLSPKSAIKRGLETVGAPIKRTRTLKS